MRLKDVQQSDVSDTSMRGKVVMITGATFGIGKATAQALAAKGATTIIVGRNPEKGKVVAAEISQATGNPSVISMTADLSSQQAIRQLADEYKRQYSQLNVLINNAGGVYLNRRVTVDGLEYTFAFNHLGYFLLTNLLLDVIKASAPARIINVSSNAQRGAKINFDDLQGEKHYTPFGAYGQSKLANVMFAYELARHMAGTGVTVNSLHPGVIRSGFGLNNGPIYRLFYTLISPFLKTPEQGAETSVYLASSPDVEGITGKYFINKKAVRSNPLSYDEEACRRLWEVSAKLTELGS